MTAAFTSAASTAAVIVGMAVLTILLAGGTLLAVTGLAACLIALGAGLWRSLRKARRVIEDTRAEGAAPDLGTIAPAGCSWCTDLTVTEPARCTCLEKCAAISWCRGWATALGGTPAYREDR